MLVAKESYFCILLGLEFIAGFFGCLSAGAIAIPAYPPRPNQSLSGLEAIATDAQATVAFTTKSLLAYLQNRFADHSELASITLLATDEIVGDKDFNPHPTTPDTLACLEYTSGSTGKPKGVMVTHGNLLHNLAMMGKAADFSSNNNLTISWMPLGHNSGLMAGVLQPLYEDFPVVLMSPLDFIQKPLRWLRAISEYKATLSFGPNFAYDLACFKTTPEERSTLDLSSWELAVSGAEPVREETLERFATTFAPYGFRREALKQAYGMAESVSFISGGKKTQPSMIQNIEKTALEENRVVIANEASKTTQKIVGCGCAWLDEKIIIVDPQSLSKCLSDQVGEIWVSSPSVAQGYWKRSQATEETFRAYLADTGEGPFLRTGDLGFLLNGELFITGRLKDLIIIRGRNHYPQDIELTVEKSHPALQPSSCAAFSVEVESEERLVIAQEVQETYLEKLDVEQVVASIRQAVSQEHQLQVYAVLLLNTGTIPKTSSGKIQRHGCKGRFLDSSLDVVASSIQTEFDVIEKQVFLERKVLLATPPEKRQALLQSHLQNLISNILKVDPSQLDWQQPLTSMGLDSLMVIELSDLLEESLGCSLHSTLIFDYPTVEALADYLVKEVIALKSSPSYNIGLVEDENLEFSSSSPLVRIQSSGSKPPLFFVPGGVGTAFYLHSLALHLGQDQPFYGLQALGMDGETEPQTNLAEIAAYYIQALQSVQPIGPYFLGGHSFGGQVAFEMSQQLQNQGHDVALLAVIDIPAPLFNQLIFVDWDDTRYMVEVVNLFAYFLKENPEISYDDLSVLSPDEQLDYVTERIEKILHVGASEAARKQVRGFVKVLKASVHAMANYLPGEIHLNRITLFRSSEVYPWVSNTSVFNEIQQDASFGWEKLSMKPVEFHSVPGDHVTMMLEPHVQVLAQQLRLSLQEARTCFLQ